ncbi:MAG: hypothetical protein QOJ07_2806 [Thermoleophilaceae bacterium]|nr:hypothetical protein [Thermoleophilaceae bacterium]
MVGSRISYATVAATVASCLTLLAAAGPAAAAPATVAKGLSGLSFGPVLVDGRVVYGSGRKVRSFDPATGRQTVLRGVSTPYSISSTQEDNYRPQVHPATCCGSFASSVDRLEVSPTRTAWLASNGQSDPADYFTFSSTVETLATGAAGSTTVTGYTRAGQLGGAGGCSPAVTGAEPEAPLSLALGGDLIAYEVATPPPGCTSADYPEERRIVARDLGPGDAAPGPARVLASATTSTPGPMFGALQVAGRYVAWSEAPDTIVVYDATAGAEVYRGAGPPGGEVSAFLIDDSGRIALSWVPDGGVATTAWLSPADHQLHTLGEGTLEAFGGGRALLSRTLPYSRGTQLWSAPLTGAAPELVTTFRGHAKREGTVGADATRATWARSVRRHERCHPARSRACRRHPLVDVTTYEVLTR